MASLACAAMLTQRAFSARRLVAAIAFLAFVVSNTEALIGEVRDGQVHAEGSQAAEQHAPAATNTGTNPQLHDVGFGENHGHTIPSHDHMDSIHHCAHQHGVGMTQALEAGVAIVQFAHSGTTHLGDYRYLPDRSMKEPPRA